MPIGSTEQHARLSLLTDALLAERVAVEAAEPLGVPVFPVLPFGLAASFAAFPGTVTLRLETFAAVLRDLLDSLKRGGFRRVVVVNGHGGNHPASSLVQEWMMDNPDCRVRLHDWWRAPRTQAQVQAIDPMAGHGGWMENFPWTRLAGTPESGGKEMIDLERLGALPPFEARNLLDDGSFGGLHRRSEAEMQAIWQVAVEETRAQIERW